MNELSAIQTRDILDTISSMRAARSKAVYIRVSESEYRAFHKAAELDDMTLSDWLRRLGRKRLEQLGMPLTPKQLRSSA